MITITRTSEPVTMPSLSKNDVRIADRPCWILVAFPPLCVLLLTFFASAKKSGMMSPENVAFFLTGSYLGLCVLTVLGALFLLFLAYCRAGDILDGK